MSLKFRNTSKQVSQISRLIEVATDANSQSSENWQQFMAICDAVNATDDGPKDAVKTIRKRLACKNAPTIMLTLKLLETCVKNCGSRFHTCIATKDFMQEMIKIISPKYNPSPDLQNTVLGLIQTWAFVFQSNPELKEVGRMYQELKAKGIEFPDLDPDQASSIFIPPKSAPPVAATEVSTARAGKPSSNPHSMQTAPTGAVHSTVHNVSPEERLAKLRSELGAVQQNCSVFGEILTEAANGTSSSSDCELIEELNFTCRQMQKRIVELLESVQNEQFIEELLAINDELNNVFLRYDRYHRLKAGRALSTPEQAAMPPPQYELTVQSRPPASHEASLATLSRTYGLPDSQPSGTSVGTRISGGVPVANLIDFDFDSSATATTSASTTAALNGNNSGVPASFDHLSSSNAESNTKQLPAKEAELAEMEKWLMANPRVDEETVHVASSEFDQFLMDRARDNENVSSRNTEAAAPTGQQQQQPHQYGNELFSL